MSVSSVDYEESIDSEAFRNQIKSNRSSFKHRSSFVHAFYSQNSRIWSDHRRPTEANNHPAESPEILDLKHQDLSQLSVVEERATITSLSSSISGSTRISFVLNHQRFDSIRSSSKSSSRYSVPFSSHETKDHDEENRKTFYKKSATMFVPPPRRISDVLHGFRKPVKKPPRRSIENWNTRKILSMCKPIELNDWDEMITKSHRTQLEEQLSKARIAEEEELGFQNAQIRRNVSVIVIGAGIAGLSAAESLIAEGFGNVKVLEASNRLGGRIYTLCDGEDAQDYLDLGVSDVDGDEEWNSVYRLADKHGLLGETHRRSYHPGMLRRRWSHKPSRCDPDCRKMFHFYTSTMDEEIEAMRFIRSKSQKEANDIRLTSSDFFRECQRRFRENRGVARDGIVMNPEKEGVEPGLKAYWKELQYDHGDSAGDADIEHFRPCRKNNSSFLRNGMKSILGPLIKRFKPNTIRYKTSVTEIDFTAFNTFNARNRSCSDGNPLVTVTSSDGKKFEASHVIVAIPLGHLKTKAQSMFRPSLSKQRLDAIDAMGFGCVGKVFLHFEQPVDFNGFEFLWSKCDKDEKDASSIIINNYWDGDCLDDRLAEQHSPKTLQSCARSRSQVKSQSQMNTVSVHQIKSNRSQVKSQSQVYAGNVNQIKSNVQFEEHNNNNNEAPEVSQTLTTIQDKVVNFSSKPNSRIVQVTFTDASVEDLPDNELITELTTLLQDLLSRKLSTVIKITKSTWRQDPLFRGTHPYLKAWSRLDLPQVLARPITFRCIPVIQFSGDYTHQVQSHLLHGARTSGLREAHRLANFYNTLYGRENLNKKNDCVSSKTGVTE